MSSDVYLVRNYPVRYIRLVGLIVGLELSLRRRYLLVNLDDSSSEIVECKVRLGTPFKYSIYKNDTLYSTSVEGLGLNFKDGMLGLVVDGVKVDISTIVKAKGTIDVY